VSGFQRSNAVQDHCERTAHQAGALGPAESAHALRIIIEEAAEPHTELEWLLLFPNIFEGCRTRLIRYAAALGRAQAAVIEHYAAGTVGPVPCPYALATREFERLFTGEPSGSQSVSGRSSDLAAPAWRVK
jgi:hypothetical protein